MIDHAFDKLELNRIEIRCAPENTKSRAVAKRLGFQREGLLGQHELLHGHYVDYVVYAILADDWSTARKLPGSRQG